jgi:hypothetical protein
MKNKGAPSDASTEVGLEINAEKTGYILMSSHQNYNLMTANKSLKNVGKFKYVGTTVTNQNCNNEEKQIKYGECLLSFSSESFVSPNFHDFLQHSTETQTSTKQKV